MEEEKFSLSLTHAPKAIGCIFSGYEQCKAKQKSISLLLKRTEDHYIVYYIKGDLEWAGP